MGKEELITKELKHYKEYDGFKIGDTVYILEVYTVKEKVIRDIFDDYYSDDCDYIVKCCFLTSPYGTDGTWEHLEDVYETKKIAEYHIQGKKDAYDRYVTRGY